MPNLRTPLSAIAAALWLAAAGPLAAAPGDQPVKPLPPSALQVPEDIKPRSASLPAKGLFEGDHLSESAKAKLTELIIEALGLRVEVALLVPTGPWEIDGGSHTDNALTTARLNAVRRFLADRGVDPTRIFVESRIDAKVKEPRLDVQLVGTPAPD